MSESAIIYLVSSDPSVRGVLEALDLVVTEREDCPPEVVVIDLDAEAEPAPRIAQLRAQFPDAPLIALSSNGRPGAVVEAVRAGAQDFVAKPALEITLRDSIEQALIRRSLRLEGRSVVERLEARGRQVEDDRRILHERVAEMAAELEGAHRQLEHAHRELRGRVAQLVMLYRIGRDLAAQSNWDDALAQLLESLGKFLQARGAALLLRSDEGRRLAARCAVGIDASEIEDAIVKLRPRQRGEGLEPVLVALEDLDSPTVIPCADREGSWRWTVVPLWHRDLDLGYLLLDKPYPDRSIFEEDFYFLITIQTVLTEEVASAQAFHQIRRLQRFQERTLDHLGSGVLTVDSEGRVRFSNAKARELMGGIDPNGLALRDRLDLGGEQPDFDTWLAGKNGDSASIEAWLARAGDDPVPVSVVTSGLPGDLPGERHHVCVIEDLRQTRALDAERRRAAHQKELLIMAAEWAHDVRTPLTGILHSAELVAGAVDPASPKLRHLGTIRTEVERINDLVNNFLDYAKPVQLKRGVGDLAQLAEQVVHLLAGPALASSRRLELVIDDGADRCPVRLDADKMKRALLNLVQNALEATPLGSQVTVRVGHGFEALEGEAQPPRRCAVLEVIDAGNGVPDEHLDRLFVPFFTTKPKGTGLGLAISEKIVRAHEGTLRYLRRDSQTILRALVPLHFSVQETGDELREIEARG